MEAKQLCCRFICKAQMLKLDMSLFIWVFYYCCQSKMVWQIRLETVRVIFLLICALHTIIRMLAWRRLSKIASHTVARDNFLPKQIIRLSFRRTLDKIYFILYKEMYLQVSRMLVSLQVLLRSLMIRRHVVNVECKSRYWRLVERMENCTFIPTPLFYITSPRSFDLKNKI